MYMPSIFNNSVFDNFDNWMDFSFPSFNQRLYGASSSQLMKTDVKETDKDYEVSIDLPGFKKEEISISLEDGNLTIQAAKGLDETRRRKVRSLHPQRALRRFLCEKLYVGDDITEEDIKAEFKHGILKIFVPKKEAKPEVEQKKYIAIEG